MAPPRGHGVAKYTTGTRLETSAGRPWRSLLAERWTHAGGDLGEVRPRDTEIVVLLEGRLRVRRRGDGRLQEHRAAPGTVWLCPAGIAEDMIHLYGPILESIHLYLPAPSLGTTLLADLDVDPARVRLRYEGGFRDPLIESIARAVSSELAAPRDAGGLLIDTLSAALGIHIARRYATLPCGSPALPSTRGALDARRLARVLAFIDARLDQKLRLEEIAREACLSPFHLARSFKAATGCPLHRYVADRRLARAREMIARGDRSLAETALACGFSSQAHLSSSFRRATGMTPGAFRRLGAARPE